MVLSRIKELGPNTFLVVSLMICIPVKAIGIAPRNTIKFTHLEIENKTHMLQTALDTEVLK